MKLKKVFLLSVQDLAPKFAFHLNSCRQMTKLWVISKSTLMKSTRTFQSFIGRSFTISGNMIASQSRLFFLNLYLPAQDDYRTIPLKEHNGWRWQLVSFFPPLGLSIELIQNLFW